MARVVKSLLIIGLVLLLAIVTGVVILLKAYLPRPETAAWFSERFSRSFGVEARIGQIQFPIHWSHLGPITLDNLSFSAPGVKGKVGWIEVPLGWNHLGAVVLHEVSFSQATPDGSRITLRGLTLKLRLSSLLRRRELRFDWIDLEEPEILFQQGAPIRTCQETFAMGGWSVGGWIGLQEAVQRAPIERLTLRKGVLRLTNLRLADLALSAEELGSKDNHLRLTGVVESSTFSFPFRAEARWGGAPFPFRLQVRLEGIPLAPFKAMAPKLDLSASRANVLLTLLVPSAKEAGGIFKARATRLFLRGAKEPFEPEVRALFRLDLDRGEVVIEKMRLGIQEIAMEGRARVRCQGTLQYVMRLASSQANLADLQEKLPMLPDAVQGRVFVQKAEAFGTWPNGPPRIKVIGGFEGVGPLPPLQGVRLAELNGRWEVNGSFPDLLVSTAFDGKAEGQLKGESVRADFAGVIQGDLRGGDFDLQRLHLHANPLGEVVLKGRVKRWGEGSIELETERLALNVEALERFIPALKEALTINALERPSLQVRLQGKQGPWEINAEAGGLSLKVQDRPIVLKGGKVFLSGRKIAQLAAEGTLAAKAIEVDGHLLKDPRLAFRADATRIQIEELTLSAYGGEVKGKGAFTISKEAPQGELRVALTHLRPVEFLLALHDRNNLRLPFALPSKGEALSLSISIDAFVKLNGREAVFQARVEPIQVVQAMALVEGLMKDLPVNLTGGEVAGEVKGMKTGDGAIRASGTISVKRLGVQPKGKGGSPSLLSFHLPFEYADGTLHFFGDRLPFEAKALLPPGGALPVQARAGQVLLSFSGEASPQGGVRLAGRVELEGFRLQRGEDSLPPVNGRVRFTFGDGLFRVPESSFRIGGGLRASATATLPFSENDLPRRFTLQIPFVKLDELQKAFSPFLPQGLLDAKLSGTIGGEVEVVGEAVKGEVRLQGFGLKAGAAGVEGVSGRIPLIGTLGASWEDRFVEWPEVSDQDPKKALKAFETLLQAFRTPPPSSPPSLTIAPLDFAGLRLEDVTFHLAPHEGRLVVEQLTFQAFGGNGWGSGVIDLFGRSIRMALMIENLSLRAICAQFPPIRDYLLGRVNGMMELSLPFSEPEKAKGQARFWVVRSKAEPRRISRDLITRLGGQYRGFLSFLWFRGDRSYDYGFLDVRLADQLLTFKRLELSHRSFFGKKDLEIKVVPPFNTIPLEDLLDTIQEVGERVQTQF